MIVMGLLFIVVVSCCIGLYNLTHPHEDGLMDSCNTLKASSQQRGSMSMNYFSPVILLNK
jgi:hypothetical protein